MLRKCSSGDSLGRALLVPLRRKKVESIRLVSERMHPHRWPCSGRSTAGARPFNGLRELDACSSSAHWRPLRCAAPATTLEIWGPFWREIEKKRSSSREPPTPEATSRASRSLWRISLTRSRSHQPFSQPTLATTGGERLAACERPPGRRGERVMQAERQALWCSRASCRRCTSNHGWG